MHPEKERRLVRINLTVTDKAALLTALDTLLKATDYSDAKFKPLYTAWLRLSEAQPYKS